MEDEMTKQLKARDVLSQAEADGILALSALNKLEKKRDIRKIFYIGKFKITFHRGDKNSMWGRFGGGWQWKLGFQASKSTLLLNCLVFSLMIYKEVTQVAEA